MKRWSGCLAAILLLGLTMAAAAEPAGSMTPSEPAPAAADGVALLSEPETLPPELTYYRGDTQLETEDLTWVPGRPVTGQEASGQAIALAAGETLRLEEMTLPAEFTLDL